MNRGTRESYNYKYLGYFISFLSPAFHLYSHSNDTLLLTSHKLYR